MIWGLNLLWNIEINQCMWDRADRQLFSIFQNIPKINKFHSNSKSPWILKFTDTSQKLWDISVISTKKNANTKSVTEILNFDHRQHSYLPSLISIHLQNTKNNPSKTKKLLERVKSMTWKFQECSREIFNEALLIEICLLLFNFGGAYVPHAGWIPRARKNSISCWCFSFHHKFFAYSTPAAASQLHNMKFNYFCVCNESRWLNLFWWFSVDALQIW